MTEITRDWYVLQVPPQREFDVADALKRMGHKFLVPYCEKWTRRNPKTGQKGKRKPQRCPVFPKYVFAGIEGGPNWHEIKDIQPGPVAPVRFGEDIPMLSQAEVGTIVSMRFEEHAPVDLLSLLVEGALARIVGGPFQGRFVRLGEVRGQHTKIELDMLGTPRAVKVPLAQLQAV